MGCGTQNQNIPLELTQELEPSPPDLRNEPLINTYNNYLTPTQFELYRTTFLNFDRNLKNCATTAEVSQFLASQPITFYDSEQREISSQPFSSIFSAPQIELLLTNFSGDFVDFDLFIALQISYLQQLEQYESADIYKIPMHIKFKISLLFIQKDDNFTMEIGKKQLNEIARALNFEEQAFGILEQNMLIFEEFKYIQTCLMLQTAYVVNKNSRDGFLEIGE